MNVPVCGHFRVQLWDLWFMFDGLYLFIYFKVFFIEVWFLVMFVINFLWLYVGGEERMKLMMGQWDDPADPLLWDVPH